MNKQEYINELRDKLRGLNEEDIEDALCYCEEYFEDAGMENEGQVIEELGSPTKFAKQIKAEAVIRQNSTRNIQKEDKNPKTSLKNVGVIFLGLCALPLALPLLLVAVTLFFVFAVVVITLIFAGIVSVASVLLSGIPLIISGFTNITQPSNALIAFGGGFLSIGFGLLFAMFIIWLIRIIIPSFMRLITRIYDKAKGGVRNEKA